jgi:hypothetical protein
LNKSSGIEKMDKERGVVKYVVRKEKKIEKSLKKKENRIKGMNVKM